MLSIFQTYESCLKDSDTIQVTSIAEGFDKDKFYKSCKESWYFFEGFFESWAWVNFLEEKLFTETDLDVFSIKFFDEKITEKQNCKLFKMKKPTNFLNEQKIEIINKIEVDFKEYEVTDQMLINAYYSNQQEFSEFLPF